MKLDEIENSELFNENDLDLMCSFQEDYAHILNSIDEYKKLSKENSYLYEYLETNEKFADYETNSYLLKKYEHCLIYYLGIQKGLGLKNLK